MQRDMHAALSSQLTQVRELVEPRIGGVEDPGGRDAEAFGGDAEAADVRDGEEARAD